MPCEPSRGLAWSTSPIWGDADFIAEVASPLPSFVVADYLGVPDSDRAAFGTWSSAIVQANASGNVLSAGQAVGELYGISPSSPLPRKAALAST